mgnify:CR=1 FL=1
MSRVGASHYARVQQDSRGGAVTMDSLFGQTVEYPSEKPSGPARLRVLVTVKAAPNPSATHGETVCVAGVRLGDVGPTGWIRL